MAAAANKVCRTKAGPCDLEELCDGTSDACPADLFVAASAGTVCRPDVGNCDVAESCDGKGAACPKDLNACSSGQYCSGSTCVVKKVNGGQCYKGYECKTGHCYDHVCCDRACGGYCRTCDKAGSVGTCKNVPDGTFPTGAGPQCSGYACDGNGNCYYTCKKDSQCVSGEYCHIYSWGGLCKTKRQTGWSCVRDGACISGTCYIKPGDSTGKCCDKFCSKCCGDCSSGTCVAKPVNTDATACGSLYSCDGSGGYHICCAADVFNCSAHCSANAWCWAGKCDKDLDPGAACVGACQCKSNACFPFICW